MNAKIKIKMEGARNSAEWFQCLFDWKDSKGGSAEAVLLPGWSRSLFRTVPNCAEARALLRDRLNRSAVNSKCGVPRSKYFKHARSYDLSHSPQSDNKARKNRSCRRLFLWLVKAFKFVLTGACHAVVVVIQAKEKRSRKSGEPWWCGQLLCLAPGAGRRGERNLKSSRVGIRREGIRLPSLLVRAVWGGGL
jgi:hypothetical protein